MREKHYLNEVLLEAPCKLYFQENIAWHRNDRDAEGLLVALQQTNAILEMVIFPNSQLGRQGVRLLPPRERQALQKGMSCL